MPKESSHSVGPSGVVQQQQRSKGKMAICAIPVLFNFCVFLGAAITLLNLYLLDFSFDKVKEAATPIVNNPSIITDKISSTLEDLRQHATWSDLFSYASSYSLSDRQTLVEHSNTLALKLFNNMEHGFGLSPLSISYSLSIVHQGARGETAREFHDLFDGQYSIADLQMIQDLYGNNQSDVIHMTNYFLINTKFAGKKSINESFVKEMSNFCRIKIDDFHDAKDLSKKVSHYFFQNTDGNIENIGRVIKPQESSVMINAVYFRAPWQTLFDPKLSVHINFTQSNQHKRIIRSLRNAYFRLPYYENDQMEMFEIPFQPADFVMGVVLPKKTGPGKLANTADINITALYDNIQLLQPFSDASKLVEVSMPRIRQRKMMRLAPEVLKKLGLSSAVDAAKADFKGIAKKGVFLSEVVHEAFFAIDEYGANTLQPPMTKDMTSSSDLVTAWLRGSAASNSGSHQLKDDASSVPAKLIQAHHNFLYYIRHKPTNMILYVGDFDG